MKNRFMIGLAFAVVAVATLQITVAAAVHQAETIPPNPIVVDWK